MEASKIIEAAFAGPHDGMCLGCDKKIGTQYCHACEVLYCATCCPVMHDTPARARHTFFAVYKPTHHADGRHL